MSNEHIPEWAREHMVSIPEGRSGAWAVERFEISKTFSMIASIQAMQHQRGAVAPGEYTRLVRDGLVIMSDTQDEIRDHLPPIEEAGSRGGHCLVNGLGLGMVASAMLRHPNVCSVTVVEKSEDVIALTGPTLLARHPERLEIVHADAFEYEPPDWARYSVVWHDIWDAIDMDNLPEMALLVAKYARRADWQGCWVQELCEAQRDDPVNFGMDGIDILTVLDGVVQIDNPT